MVPQCKEKASAASELSQVASEFSSNDRQRSPVGVACMARESWSLAGLQSSRPWSDPRYGGFDIEPSRSGLLLQQACRLGDLGAVVAMRPTASLVEASLHALPIAANAGHIDVVRELLTWPLPDKEAILMRVIALIAEAGHAEMVRYLVQTALANDYCRPDQLRTLFEAVTSVGDLPLFYELAARVGPDADWQLIMFVAAERKHWTCAVFAWERCKDRDLEGLFSDKQMSQLHEELGRQQAARNARDLQAASSCGGLSAGQPQVRRL
ncbi:hypothetical protein BCL79_0762 [Stenotrophomonas rhizophila]|uniref:Ankyrin repeat protein n=1 Tax=Stenotrophomonas rhizophila TaxID=216778 RepID=A0A498CFE9_9GAMM|nr:hypothetical protein BCL79_0762 [Stenotrophomonas rhizophila]